MVAAYLIAIASATVAQSSSVSYLEAYSQDLQSPARLAPAPGGGIYVTDQVTGRVLEYANSVDPPAVYTAPGSPVGIAFRPDVGGDGGKVLLSMRDGTVQLFDTTFAHLDTLPGTLDEPNDMAVYAVTTDVYRLYVVDSGASEIVVYQEGPTDTWTEVNRFSTEGAGLAECTHPQAIAIDPDLGQVIITDADNYRAQVFNLAGFHQYRFGHRLLYMGFDEGYETWLARSEGVAVDACSNIYIADALMGVVRVFDPAGAELDPDFLPVITYGTGPGEVRNPIDIAIVDGKLYVASAYNAAVEVYDVLCTASAMAPKGFNRSDVGKVADTAGRLGGLEPVKKARHTPSAPDNPFDLVSLIDSGTFSRSYDLNLDRRVDIADLEIAVERFGVGTVDDFLGDGGVADSGHDPPHVLDIDDACGRCHSMNDMPGGLESVAGQENLCLSCHTGGGLALNALISPTGAGGAHPRGVPANQGGVLGPEPGSLVDLYLDGGNIKCATCHNQHDALYEPYLRLDGSRAQLCGSCHAEGPEWEHAGHADPNGEAFIHYDWTLSNRDSCRKCHSGLGYVDFTEGLGSADQRGDLHVHSCVVCHDLHDNTDPDFLRTYDQVELPGSYLVTDAGPNATCMVCHEGRRTPGGTSLTPHYMLGAVMLEGINGDDFGNTSLTNSAHTALAGCVDCHMAPTAASGKVGGHSFKMAWHNPGGFCTGGIDDGEACTVDADCDHVDPEDGLGTCTPTDPDDGFENVDNGCNSQACHGAAPLTVLNRLAWADYDNDAVTEGIQDEVLGLLDLVLSALVANDAVKLDSYPYWLVPGECAVGNPHAGELCYDDADCDSTFTCSTSGGPCVIDEDCPEGETCEGDGVCDPGPDDATIRSGIWNYEYVGNDHSLGIHNTDYAVGLLQLTYEMLTGAPLPANLLYTP